MNAHAYPVTTFHYYLTDTLSGTAQRVANNHVRLICGYDPARGYFVSDPYNLQNRGQVYQYWIDAQHFESCWNERKMGMVMRYCILTL